MKTRRDLEENGPFVHSKHNYLKNVKIKGKRKEIMTKKTKDIPKKNIQYKLHKSITKASDELGVSETKLKKECRKNGIKRWPSRKISMIKRLIFCITRQSQIGSPFQYQKIMS